MSIGKLNRGCMTMSKNESIAESLSLLKLVHISILISLLWKVRYFLYFQRVNTEFPLEDTFFPKFFQSAVVLITAYGLAILGSAFVVCLKARKLLLLFSVVSLSGLVVLCVHQNSYNDVTFLCCAWASLWCLWYATRLHEPFETLYPRAAWLTHLILSMIFIGGAIGKLTPGYWSGDVLYEIYFKDRDFWTYNLLRESMSSEGLRTAAMWHSRMVLCSELLCGLIWLMPRKLASIIAIVVLCGIALTNNIFLFSVVTSLIGLALVGLHERKSAPDSGDDSSR